MNTSTNAANNPVRRRGAEINTGDLPIGQPGRIILPAEGLPDREEIAQVPGLQGGKQLSKYMSDLSFAEEPITIRIEPGQGKFAPKIADCWVNGIGAEFVINGKFVRKGWLPVGVEVITKRKYVEVLLRSKPTNVSTPETPDFSKSDDDNNWIDRRTSCNTPITIIRDDSPASRDWYAKIMMEG